MNIEYKKFFSGRILAILCIGLLLGSVGTTWYGIKYLKAPADSALEHEYYSDELFLFGKDGNGKVFSLDLSLNRAKEQGNFVHYYRSKAYYNGTKDEGYTQFLKPKSPVESSSFLRSYQNTPFADLSSRESIDLSYDFKGTQVNIRIPELQADFLIKNTPEYTKYVSIGEAKVTFGEEEFTAHAAFVKVYSTDDTKYLFFDGYKNLKSRTIYAQIWDKQGNFYLIDSSDVTSVQKNYTSHTWVLYKNAKESSMRRFFSIAQSTDTDSGGNLNKFSFSIPGLSNNKLSAVPLDVFSTGDAYLLSGEVEGHIYIHDYGK